MKDKSANSKIVDPLFVFGNPPTKLIKIDDDSFEQPIMPDEVETYAKKHGGFSFGLPDTNLTFIKEHFDFGKVWRAGQSLFKYNDAHLQKYFNYHVSIMTKAQRNNFRDNFKI